MKISQISIDFFFNLYYYKVMAKIKSLNKGIRVPIHDSTATDIHIIGFCVEKNSPTWNEIDGKKANQYTIHYVLNGRGYLVINGVKHDLQPDTIFVTFPKQDVRFAQNFDDPYTIGWIVLDGLKVKSLLERIGITPENLILPLRREKSLRDYFAKTPYICASAPDFSDVIALGTFYNILSAVMRQLPQNNISNLMSTQEMHVSDAINYINSNFQNVELNLETVANAISVSPKYLSNIFAKITDTPFSQYLMNKRMSYALSLIGNGETVVSVISEKCGFSSPYYFSNVFRHYNTDSPKQHIKRRIDDLKKLPPQ